MSQSIFEGNYGQADTIVKQYKQQHSHDPHARELFLAVGDSSSLLSFYSTSTDRDEIIAQRNDRIRAWLRHMPLDFQLGWAQLDLFGRTFKDIPLEAFSWSQWHDLTADPSSTVPQSSPLYPIEYKNPSARSRVVKRKIAQGIRLLALECLNNGTYEMLDQVMTQGRISPWHACSSFYMPHRSDHSSGWTFAQLSKPVPFWALGVFHAGQSDQYWKVMGKHGGPQLPFAPNQAQLPPQIGNSPSGVDTAPAPTAEEWVNPIDWIVPDQTISRVLSEQEAGSYISSVVRSNLACWRKMSLLPLASHPSSSSTARPSI